MSRTLELLADLRAHRAVMHDLIEERRPAEDSGLVLDLLRQEMAVLDELLGDGAAHVKRECAHRWYPGSMLRAMPAERRRHYMAQHSAAMWLDVIGSRARQAVGRFTRSALRGEIAEIEIDFSRYTQLQPVRYPVLWSVLDGI